MNKNHKLLFNIILISIMSALSFTMTFVAIPIGNSKVHLGNAICVLVSLLFGPIVGGVSGSIGMGLNDLLLGYPPQTWIRTFIAKLIMGLIAGIFFKCLSKKERTKIYHFIISSSIFLMIGITFIVLMLINGKQIKIADKIIELNIFIPILSLLLSISLFIIYMIFKDKDDLIKKVLIAATYATIINIIIEFTLKLLLNTIFTASVDAAMISCITSIPATILTGIVSIIIVSTIYIPIRKSLNNYFEHNKSSLND